MSQHPPTAVVLRQKLLAVIGLSALAMIVLAAVYLHLVTERQAEKLTLDAGSRLSVQSELLIRPLMLANDRVSLNYLLNELSASEQLSGLQIQDNQGIVIARSGSASELKLSKRIQQQERTLATLTLWLTPDSIQQQLRSQHLPMLILALLGTALMLLLILWVTRKASHDTDTATTSMDTAFAPTFAEELAEQRLHYDPSIDVIDEKPAEGDQVQPWDDVEIAPTPQPSSSILQNTLAKELDRVQTDAITVTPDELPEASTPQTTDALVDLLKPEPESKPLMPKFEHQPQDLTPEADTEEAADKFELQEQEIAAQTEAPSPPTNIENPLFKLDSREEVQLDLYSFEHELELILPPQDALYLCYIDTRTASSENIQESEKQALIQVYLKLAKQVARIYNGECEQLDNQDIVLRFELHDDQDRHGINGLCAAMLFSLLYKGFNQARIRSMQPVLSLHMSLARGHHGKPDLVREEAHFLTRTTNSNDLISHTALTEAPLIKQAVLDAADIRREDEDKVLLLKLTPKHQTLLQKQANHLLTKLFRKA